MQCIDASETQKEFTAKIKSKIFRNVFQNKKVKFPEEDI